MSACVGPVNRVPASRKLADRFTDSASLYVKRSERGTMRSFTGCLLVLAALGSAAPAAAQDWNWRGRVSAGQWFEVKGVIGSVRAVAGSGSEIEIEATKTAQRNDPDEVE